MAGVAAVSVAADFVPIMRSVAAFAMADIGSRTGIDFTAVFTTRRPIITIRTAAGLFGPITARAASVIITGGTIADFRGVSGEPRRDS